MTSPNKPSVDGAYTASDIAQMQQVTQQNYEQQLRDRVLGGFLTGHNNFRESIQKTVLDPIRQIFQGLVPKGWEDVAQAFQDGQVALKSRLDLLSTLLDYGSCYMDAKGGFLEFGLNSGTMPFVNQLGPMKGCELYDDGIRLLDKGLWDIRAQLTFGWNALAVGSGHVEWRVRVYRPDGALFSEQIGHTWNVREHSATIVSSVVVPEPNYVVKVEISWIHGSRQIWGGPANNRLVVQHISRKIDDGNMGDGDSYNPGTSGEEQ